MRFLPLILFAPTFALLAWLYWRFPSRAAHTPRRNRYDAGAILSAMALTAVAVDRALPVAPDATTGPIWPQVMATLVAYHVFPLVIAVAWLLRRHLTGRSILERL